MRRDRVVHYLTSKSPASRIEVNSLRNSRSTKSCWKSWVSGNGRFAICFVRNEFPATMHSVHDCREVEECERNYSRCSLPHNGYFVPKAFKRRIETRSNCALLRRRITVTPLRKSVHKKGAYFALHSARRRATYFTQLDMCLARRNGYLNRQQLQK